jgi:hypothetical protein
MTRVYRRRRSIREQQIAAVDRFSAAVTAGDQVAIQAAADDLLAQFADIAQRLAVQAVMFLASAQEVDREMAVRMREQLTLHQRHLEQIDRILDEQARSCAVGD